VLLPLLLDPALGGFVEGFPLLGELLGLVLLGLFGSGVVLGLELGLVELGLLLSGVVLLGLVELGLLELGLVELGLLLEGLLGEADELSGEVLELSLVLLLLLGEVEV
jgi:hypothetical protein